MAKNLDQELESVLADSDARAAEARPSNEVGPRPPSEPKKGSPALLVGLLVMGGALAALFLFGFKEAAIYALPADQVVARATELEGRRLRVEGELVPGTLVKRDAPCEYRFVIKASGKELPIRYAQCVIPDTFRDRPEGGVQVTVEGALAKQGGLEATQVMAKCSSKYDPQTHEMVAADGTRTKPTEADLAAIRAATAGSAPP